MTVNLPTQLTWARVALIPLMVAFFYWDNAWGPFLAAFCFGMAGLTDWADGYLARQLKLESAFGAFLDPVADKLLVAVAVLLIVEREANFWFTLAACILIGREIVVSALREWMAEQGNRSAVAVAFVGKLKTTAQIIALMFLLYNSKLFGFLPMREAGIIALILAVVLSFYSMMVYLRSGLSKV